MGISRDSRHKRRATGGRMPIHKKKRAFEKGRPIANTRVVESSKDVCVRRIRVRGGNFKFRALRLEIGNFYWQSEGISRKTKITTVVYNASSNELVRTNTLVKNAIVYIDDTPFKSWYLKHYGIDLAKKLGRDDNGNEDVDELQTANRSKRVVSTLKRRNVNRFMDPNVRGQFASGKLLACISSRPG